MTAPTPPARAKSKGSNASTLVKQGRKAVILLARVIRARLSSGSSRADSTLATADPTGGRSIHRREMPAGKQSPRRPWPPAVSCLRARPAILTSSSWCASSRRRIRETILPRRGVPLRRCRRAGRCGASRAGPLAPEGLREPFLPRMRLPQPPEQQAPVRSAGRSSPQGGTEPDLLDEGHRHRPCPPPRVKNQNFRNEETRGHRLDPWSGCPPQEGGNSRLDSSEMARDSAVRWSRRQDPPLHDTDSAEDASSNVPSNVVLETDGNGSIEDHVKLTGRGCGR